MGVVEGWVSHLVVPVSVFGFCRASFRYNMKCLGHTQWWLIVCMFFVWFEIDWNTHKMPIRTQSVEVCVIISSRQADGT